jgi:hypothetical protein
VAGRERRLHLFRPTVHARTAGRSPVTG